MNSVPRFHKPFITLLLLLAASLACGLPPSQTPEPTIDIAQAIGGTQTAAAILTPQNIIITFPTNTNTVEPAFTTAPTLMAVPTDTLAPLPTNTFVVVLPTLAPAAGACSCAGDTLNCSDFLSHTSAQDCFNYCVSIGRGDIHKLDSNNDGSACESLP